jgi:hypothetical protein
VVGVYGFMALLILLLLFMSGVRIRPLAVRLETNQLHQSSKVNVFREGENRSTKGKPAAMSVTLSTTDGTSTARKPNPSRCPTS